MPSFSYILVGIIVVGGIVLAYFAIKRVLADPKDKSRRMRRWEKRRARRS